MQFLPCCATAAYKAGKNKKPLDRQQKACFLPVWGTDEIQGTQVDNTPCFSCTKSTGGLPSSLSGLTATGTDLSTRPADRRLLWVNN